MASGSSGRNNSVSKGFDFASDDILSSYEDFSNQDGSNGNHSDPPPMGANADKEFHKSRMARSLVFPVSVSSYSPPEESINQDVISAVERSVKKYTDNLMRFLEGLSSRLSQLELYCYNLDKSIGEMHSDLVRDHGEADSKLKSLEKHLQEVHRSVQILRDKQELAETQKELAKLQFAQKETSQNEERSSPSASNPKKSETSHDASGQQLALVLPHQVAPQPPAAPQPAVPHQTVSQSQAYYLPPPQLPNLPSPAPAQLSQLPSLPAPAPTQLSQLPNLPTATPARTQISQGQYLPADSQYRAPPPPAQSQANQPQSQALPLYPLQQWAPQLPQQVQPPQPSVQSPVRSSATPVYSPYLQSQPPNPTPSEPNPSSLPMQIPYSAISQSSQTLPYGYGGPARMGQLHPPPQHLKATFGGQSSEAGYPPSGPHQTLSQGNTYVMYESEGGRVQQHPAQQSHFSQHGFPPNPQQLVGMIRPPQFMRNNPYSELVEKLVTMGYRADHVMIVINRLEESGQPVDFNAVLDRLNGHSSSGGSQRGGWSG